MIYKLGGNKSVKIEDYITMVEKMILIWITMQFMGIEQKIEKNMLLTQNKAKKNTTGKDSKNYWI